MAGEVTPAITPEAIPLEAGPKAVRTEAALTSETAATSGTTTDGTSAAILSRAAAARATPTLALVDRVTRVACPTAETVVALFPIPNTPHVPQEERCVISATRLVTLAVYASLQAARKDMLCKRLTVRLKMKVIITSMSSL